MTEDVPPRARVSTPPPALRLADLLREIGGARLVAGAGDVVVTGVHHDSRKVEPGDVFVARPGGKADGARFVRDAVSRGAVAVIAAPGAVPTSLGVPLVEADDVPHALAIAASAVYGHPTFGLDVVGITGTNGKTTTSRLVRAMLESAGHRTGVVGTLGHELGAERWATEHTSPEADELMRVARSMLGRGATHLVMEVSSIALTARRADGVRFRVAAFTNLTQDHLDYHGTMEAYAEAKARLFTELGPGASVVNVGDAFGAVLAARLPRSQLVSYARQGDARADVTPAALSMGEHGIELRAATPIGDVDVRSPLVGEHNVENLLAAVAIGVALELSAAEIGRGLSADVPVAGRLERCDDPARDDVVVLVDYAHTPDALARVLASVRPFTRGQVRCVFGCGGDRDPQKRPLMGEAASEGADWVVITNDNPRSEAPEAIRDQILPGLVGRRTPFEVELDRRLAIRRAVLGASPGDVVLVAGKGHETYQIVGDVTHAFDDRTEAREALSMRRATRGGEAKP